MPESKEDFRSLMEQYISGEISEQDKEKLHSMIDMPEYADDLEDILRNSYSRDVDESLFTNEIVADDFFKKLKEKLSAMNNAPVHKMFWRRKIAVAAGILLLSGLAVFFLLKQQTSRHPVTASNQGSKVNDLKPGTNGAVLTLSNGQKIILDSAGNGVLASDANVKVVKKGDNIVYQGLAAENLFNTISTDKGNQWQLQLSDGTRVWLNAASSIHYPLAFSGNERKVEITGEAYFEVAHNSKKPFKVITPDGAEVQVLGTKFNINSYTNEPVISTTLLEGAVKFIAKGHEQKLTPGEQAVLYSSGKMELKKDADLDEVLAWKNGVFQFNAANIYTIMRQVERWYDVKVEYRDKITKIFQAEIPRNVTASKLFYLLELTGNVKFEIYDKKVIVTK